MPRCRHNAHVQPSIPPSSAPAARSHPPTHGQTAPLGAMAAAAGAGASYDRRRINAPDTQALVFAGAEAEAEAGPSSLGRAQGQPTVAASRSDVGSVHPLFVQTGLVRQANGSAYLESAHVKVACAVYGPRQAHSGSGGGGAGGSGTAAVGGGGGGGGGNSARTYADEAEINVDVRFASFATPHRRRKPGRDTESPSLASAVRAALLPSVRLDLLPKAAIDVYITILEADAGLGAAGGSGEENDAACAAAAATAASCAMADAGIQLWALVVGVHGVWSPTSKQQRLIVDASNAEARGATGALILWSMPALGTVTALEQLGSMSLDAIDEVRGRCSAQTPHRDPLRSVPPRAGCF